MLARVNLCLRGVRAGSGICEGRCLGFVIYDLISHLCPRSCGSSMSDVHDGDKFVGDNSLVFEGIEERMEGLNAEGDKR